MEDIPTDRDSPVRLLVTTQLISAVGDGAFYVIFAVYLASVAHLSPAQIGVLLSAAWGAGFLLTQPIGAFGDRIGLRGTAIAAAFGTAGSLGVLVAVDDVRVIALACASYAISQSGAGAVRQALLVALVPTDELVNTRARIQTAVNLGIGVGAAVGGFALTLADPGALGWVLLGDAVAFAVSAALLTRLPVPARVPPSQGSSWEVLRDRRYVRAAGLNAVMHLYMPMLSVVLPLYLTSRTAAPRWAIAAVFAVNTLGVVVAQRRAARRVVTLADAARAVRQAGAGLLVACVLFWTAGLPGDPSGALFLVAIAAIVQVVAEVRLAAGSWGIGFGLAEPTRPGQWQGVYASGIPLARAIGPAILTFLLLTWAGPGWLVLGLIFVAASVLTAVVALRPSAAGTRLSRPNPACLR